MLEWALYYASIGWHVFPIVPKEKRPLTRHGFKDATTDKLQINNWWTKWPNANIAVACGKASGVYVVDIDVDTKTGKNGWKSLEGLPSMPMTVSQLTPRGGCHLFFKTNNPLANKTDLLHGVDIRGEGGYVLLVPSQTSSDNVSIDYRWIDGQSPSECGLAEYPDFMRSENLSSTSLGFGDRKPARPSEEPRHLVEKYFSDSHPIKEDLTRAAAYLQACEPAVQGEGGHDRLLWAAVAMVHKFRLTDAQAHCILADEYNPRCTPPWDLSIPSEEKDFRRKISEARKLTPRESFDTFLDGPGDVTNVDITQIMANHLRRQEDAAQASRESHSFRWGGTNDSLYEYLTKPSGLLGRICAWINNTAYRPQPMLTLACSLAFFGTLIGRRVCGEDDVRTNLYCIGVAPSSAGKNHAMNKIRQLAYDTGCEDRLGGGKFASDSAIEKRLSENPATLFICDEIGHMLISFKMDRTGNKSGIVALLMELYSMANQVYRGKEYATQEARTLVQPCCSLYGVSTPDRLAQSISPDEINDGWIARCLIFDVGSGIPDGRDVVSTLPAPQDVMDYVVGWETRIIQPSPTKLSHFLTVKNGKAIASRGLLPNMIEVPYSVEAKNIFKEMDSISIMKYKSLSDMGPVWMKSTEKAKRISIILAASENSDSPVVSASNAIYACRLISFLLNAFSDRVLGRVANNNEESAKQRILLKISNSGVEGIERSTLTRLTQWVTKIGRNHMLSDLIQGGFIVVIDTNKRDKVVGGRHGVAVQKLRYWAVEHYKHVAQDIENEIHAK